MGRRHNEQLQLPIAKTLPLQLGHSDVIVCKASWHYLLKYEKYLTQKLNAE